MLHKQCKLKEQALDRRAASGTRYPAQMDLTQPNAPLHQVFGLCRLMIVSR
jgi:hypothetical protein